MANNYSTSVQIPKFSGISQVGDGYNRNMQYAWEMENVAIDGGSFRPMREGLMIEQALEYPIETLAYLHRRFGTNKGTLLVAVCIEPHENAPKVYDTVVYTKLLDSSDAWVEKYRLVRSDEMDTAPSGEFDWLTYEISTYPAYHATLKYSVGDRCTHDSKAYKCTTAITTPETWTSGHWTELTVGNPVDILLFTNAVDGMFCLYGDTQDVVPVQVTTDPEDEVKKTENIKFGVITRYNERIWGSGVIEEPDMLMYCAPYEPFNWKQNDEIPADGAGDIRQPSWDGDSFVALRQHGNALLAVKRNSIWRINGTDPGTFVMTQQYGGGTIEENSLISFNEYVYMLGENGLMRYDGIGAYAFLQDEIQKLMYEQVNHSVMDKATAGMRDGVYCLALPINGSPYCNAILEYDTYEGYLALRTGITVDSFMQIDERLFYTSAIQPGRVFELQDRIGRPLECKWISGYQDLGEKNSIKSAFVVYMMVDSEAPVELRVGIRTEKKLKQKTVFTKPGKMTRMHLNLQGRIFRLEIQSFSSVPFTISGGVRIDLELDPD